jgi:hypothetical protein
MRYGDNDEQTMIRHVFAWRFVAALLAGSAFLGCGKSGGAPDNEVAEASTDASTSALSFCRQEIGLANSCALFGSSPCADVLSPIFAQECATAYGSVYNDSYFNFFADCGYFSTDCSCLEGSCSDAGAAAQSAFYSCVEAKLAASVPSIAAQKLKTDFCSTCAASAAATVTCSGFYSLVDSPTLLLQDDVVQAIDVQCTGTALRAMDGGNAAEDCSAKFLRCMASVVERAAPTLASPCANDGGAGE